MRLFPLPAIPRSFLWLKTSFRAMAESENDLCRRFEACMVLGGVGDALGYRNGEWEFCRSGEKIHQEAIALGGIEKVAVNVRDWMVSDDTVMHMATADALLSPEWSTSDELYCKLAHYYKECMHDMAGRGPGLTCSAKVHELRPKVPGGYRIPFDHRGGGCGAAMRAAPVGLYYWHPEEIDNLVAVSIESGRMTHNHPTGYLGALAVALFVSYSVQKRPLREWGVGLMQTLTKAKEYVMENSPEGEKKFHDASWSYFKEKWTTYLHLRKLETGETDPVFEDHDVGNIKARDIFYKSLSYSGTGGASGHDAPIIAYEALLNTWKPTDDKQDQWINLCKHSMLHGGDSDSTGILAAACWGAMEGYAGVPENHYKKLEYRDRLTKLGKKLFEKARK